MDAPPILQRHRSLRWLAPVTVVGVIAVVGMYAGGVFRAGAADRKLPDVRPGTLVAAVRAPVVRGFSGTAVTHMSLGLPELPSFGASADSATLTSLLSGSHTLQVWYGGVNKQRVAVLGATDETDVFRDGRDVWRWASADHVALHAVLPADQERGESSPEAAAPSMAGALTATPNALARGALAALDPTTRIAVHTGTQVADRPAYDLVLKPRSTQSRIGSVHIAVDGATKIPLGVRIYPRGSNTPAVDVAYTSIRFARPANTSFQFSPPSGATVRQLRWPGSSFVHHAGAVGGASTGGSRVTVIGSGWTTILEYRLAHPGQLPIQGAGGLFTPVSGHWGSGRLLETDLVSVLLTKDGRIFAGAVDPAALYAAAATK